jgi:GMP synthase (glutamine-hydrolysing)
VFVDTGLLRLDEGDQVMETMFAAHGRQRDPCERRSASSCRNSRASSDPEPSARSSAACSSRSSRKEAQKLAMSKWLAQGTIYPDVIESAGVRTGKAHVIKSHHNVGGLPERMKLGAGRAAARAVQGRGAPHRRRTRPAARDGLPASVPGAGARRAHPRRGAQGLRRYLLRRADAIFIEELRRRAGTTEVSQAFAVFLPVRSVGVVGDGRRYEWVIALRAVETIDFMTARWAHLPYELLEHVSRPHHQRSARHLARDYDISGKPPATIEWE